MKSLTVFNVKTGPRSAVAMRRHINPDGSTGGLVAENAKFPKTTFIPFDSMLAPGARVREGEIIPAGTIIGRSGSRYPNDVQFVGAPPG